MAGEVEPPRLPGAWSSPAYARLTLATELVGPPARLSAADVEELVAPFPPYLRKELGEWWTNRLQRHETFASLAEHLAVAYRDAVEACRPSLDAQGGSTYREVGDLLDGAGEIPASFHHLSAISNRLWGEGGLADDEPRTAAAQDAVAALVRALLAASDMGKMKPLRTLGWPLDWLLALARARAHGLPVEVQNPWTGGLFLGATREESRDIAVSIESDGQVWELGTPRPAGMGQARQALLTQARLIGPGPSQDAAAFLVRVRSAVDLALKAEYAPRTRPYSLSMDKIRRDVQVWTRVKLEDEPTSSVAADAGARFDDEADFFAGGTGRRARFPTTESGVYKAVRRVEKLLVPPTAGRLEVAVELHRVQKWVAALTGQGTAGSQT